MSNVIYFYDVENNNRCIGYRELLPGEVQPENTTFVPVVIPDMHEAFFDVYTKTWEVKEIYSLIKTLQPDIKDGDISKLAHTFNNNPYLITQAIKGDIKSIQGFSKKIIDDAKNALIDFNLSDREIKDLLFNLSLLTPISKNNIAENYKNIINKLVEKKILRELTSKYRFNPDIILDLYLS